MSNIQPKIISQAKKEENMNYDDKKLIPRQPRTGPDIRISRQELLEMALQLFLTHTKSQVETQKIEKIIQINLLDETEVSNMKNSRWDVLEIRHCRRKDQ